MEQIKNFFHSFTFLIGFMILCIFMQMLLGKQVLYKFLWLVLAGMIVVNVDTFNNILKNAGTLKEAEPTNSPQSNKAANNANIGVVANNEKRNKLGILNGGLHI